MNGESIRELAAKFLSYSVFLSVVLAVIGIIHIVIGKKKRDNYVFWQGVIFVFLAITFLFNYYSHISK